MHKIGVISDTHGLLRTNVTEILRTCDTILHGGDFGTPQIVDQLKAIAPLHAVRGNTDKDWAAGLAQSLSMELYGVKIFLIHNKRMIREDIHDRDIIIYGHSHKFEELHKNGQTWLNPGSCGTRRFSLPVTMAIISVSADGAFEIERIPLDAATDAASKTAPIKDMRSIVIYVMRGTDKGKPVEAIAKSCKISEELAAQICRLYLTHPGVSPDGILKKMGL